MSKQLTAVAILALVAGTAMAAPRESLPGPASLDVYDDVNSAPTTFTLNFTGVDGTPYQATRIIVAGMMTSNIQFTWPNDNSMDITPPGAGAVTLVLSPVIGGYVTQAFSANGSLGGAVAPAGEWSFAVYDTYDDDDAGDVPESIITDITVTLDDTPAATNTAPETADNLGALVDGTMVTRNGDVAAGGTLWYKWTSLDTSVAAGRKLTLSTEASTNGGDSEIGVFTSDGTFVAFNDDFTGLYSRVTFGAGGLSGDLAAGEYYGALSTYNAEFASTFSVTSTGLGGNFQLDVTQEFVGDLTPEATDLGTLVDGVTVSATAEVPAGGVVWYTATVGDVSAAAGRSLTVSTLNSTNGGDSEIAIYDSVGAGIVTNDDAGGGLLSQIVMGRDGFADLAPGLYYFPVSSFNANFFIASWQVESTGPGGTFLLELLQTNSFPPEAVAATARVTGGQLFTVTVTPGVNPDSTGIAVSMNLSTFGGSATQTLFDNGTNGDVTAGDNIFSYIATVPAGATDADTYTVSYTVTDQQSNSITGDVTFNVDANNTIATAEVPDGTGTLDTLTGTLEFANDVDIYLINICDFANFSATTQDLGVTIDTRLWLFSTSGMGVTFNDDTVGGTNLQSTITAVNVSANGDYYLAISRYTVSAVDDSGNPLWNPADPFQSENAPSGAGAGNPLGGWIGASFGAGEYTIGLTGACFSTGGGACSEADIGIAGGLPGQDGILDNNDFIAFINYFFAQNAIADMGIAGGLPGSDGVWDNNDFIAFINHFFADVANCNG